MDKNQKRLIKSCIKLCTLFAFIYFFPKLGTFYLACGIIDFKRNNLSDWPSINRYFFGNGLLTWLLSPFNLLIDLFSDKNKGIYKLTDLPKDYQDEINDLLDIFSKEDVLHKIEEKMHSKKRGMVFFKWYGKNIDSFLKVDQFHKSFKYIKTIGVLVFNKRQSTSIHFGPLRATFRVLYNFNPIKNENVYIQVGKHRHFWHDNSFFIFDDTLMHQSINEADQLRYCLFVDVIRPSKFPSLMSTLVKYLQFILLQINRFFYKNWDFL